MTNLRSFGSYELLKRFAVGGTSELWLALPKQRRGDNRPLLLKRLLPHIAEDPEATELFLREAKLGANLQHPNIVRIRECGEAEHTAYIARDFISGNDLRTVQRRPELITPVRALHIIASVCEALAHAHHRVDHLDRPQPLIHGELAPRHILIGNEGEVKVIGFMGNKPVKPQVLGGFRVMAPEQVLGNPLDHRTDIFTAGHVLYELLTGDRPRRGGFEQYSARATIERQIPPPSQVASVPRELDAVVLKALAWEPDDRYQDVRDFLRALEEYLTAEATRPRSEELMAMMFHLSKSEGAS
jgi:serine/threonine protein kinase